MYKKIYFMGLKGVGMASLAICAKEAGFIVAGSDVSEEFITDKTLKEAKIEIYEGFDENNPRDFFGTLNAKECLFIATGAHGGFENEESLWAQSMQIKLLSHGEALGLFMSGKPFERSDIEGISVSGSHGKTTISAMLAFLLSKLSCDPSYVVGTSEILGIGAGGRYGKGKYFVAEADEYMAGPLDPTPRFFYQHPKFLIINNIDFDHPDFYRDIDAVKNAFIDVVSELNDGSVVIANGDDGRVLEVCKKTNNKVITYGTSDTNEFVIKDFKAMGFGSTFQVFGKGTLIGEFKLSIPGYHNAKNSLAAISLMIELGFSIRSIQSALCEFKGSARRLEKIGETASGVLVFDDYAHHPEEIRKTLEALKQAFPDKKITVIFQAHTYERTKALMSEFQTAFSGINELIVMPTFVSKRNTQTNNLDFDREFVERVRMFLANVKLIEKDRDVVEYLDQNIISPNQLILTMGAGDVYKVAYRLVSK